MINCEHPRLVINPGCYSAVGYHHYIYLDGVKTFCPNTNQLQFSELYELLKQYKSIDPATLDRYYTLDFMSHKVPLFILVPCNHCILCRHKRSNILSQRCEFEAESHDDLPYFVTLTFAPYALPKNNQPKQQHITNYIKRLREHVHRADLPDIRFYMQSEFGEKGGRLHYHALIFGLPTLPHQQIYDLVSSAWRFKKRITTVRKGKIVKVRPLLGRVTVTQINDPAYRAYYERTRKRPLDPAAGIRYCCSYTTKDGGVSSWSKGLGSAYVEKTYSAILHQSNAPTSLMFRNRYGRTSPVIMSRWFLGVVFKTFNRCTYRLRSQLIKSLCALHTLNIPNKQWFLDKLQPYIDDMRFKFEHVTKSSFKYWFNRYKSAVLDSGKPYKIGMKDFFRFKTLDFSDLEHSINYYIEESKIADAYLKRFFASMPELTPTLVSQNVVNAHKYYNKSLTLKSL